MSPSYAVLSLVNDRLQDLGKEDMFEITGKNVASKLRILTKEQRIILLLFFLFLFSLFHCLFFLFNTS
jgi:hypothetical protein